MTPEERERRARNTEKNAERREAIGGYENQRQAEIQREHARKLREEQR